MIHEEFLKSLRTSARKNPEIHSNDINIFIAEKLKEAGGSPIHMIDNVKSREVQLELKICAIKASMNVNMAQASKAKLKRKKEALDNEYQKMYIEFESLKKEYQLIQLLKDNFKVK